MSLTELFTWVNIKLFTEVNKVFPMANKNLNRTYRTTIRMTSSLNAALLRIAAKRLEEGREYMSTNDLMVEAIEQFVEREQQNELQPIAS